jgi:hypothetical protein
MEKIALCHKVGLDNLEKIEIGPEPAVFKSKYSCMRIFYGFKGQAGFFHTFRATNTRLFNNIVIMIKNQEEAKGIVCFLTIDYYSCWKLSSTAAPSLVTVGIPIQNHHMIPM